MLALQHGTFRVLAQHAYGASQEAKLLTPKTMKQRTKAGITKSQWQRLYQFYAVIPVDS